MYHYQLTFVLIGIHEELAEMISGLAPLDGFSHQVKCWADLKAVPAPFDGNSNTVVILRDDGAWTPELIQKKFGERARLVLCTDKPERLDEAVLSHVYEIWPYPLEGALARYEAERLRKRIKEEKDAWLNEEYLDILINMLPDMVWFKDMPGCHLKLNDAFCEAVGKTKEDVTGKFHGYIWGLSEEDAEHGEAVCRESEMAVAKEGRTCHFEETVRHSRRGLCELSILKSPVYDEDHKVIGTIGIARDVTREKEDQAKILQLAHTDALTGLANRRYFYRYMEENRKGAPLAVCYIDLDHFKNVNDTYGHQSGDAALLGVAELLRNAFPKDVITRLGGDEFVVAILGYTSREEILGRIEHLMDSSKAFFQLDECLMGLSMSIGIALAGDESISLEKLLQQGDQALYYSKEHGKARFTFYDDIC